MGSGRQMSLLLCASCRIRLATFFGVCYLRPDVIYSDSGLPNLRLHDDVVCLQRLDRLECRSICETVYVKPSTFSTPQKLRESVTMLLFSCEKLKTCSQRFRVVMIVYRIEKQVVLRPFLLWNEHTGTPLP